MKNDPLIQILIVVLAVCALGAWGLYFFYNADMRELRGLQAQLTFIANRRAASQALVGEAVEYSKRNPAIIPLLESFGIQFQNPAPAAAAKPGQK